MIRTIVALLSSLLVAVQVFLLVSGKSQLCFNDGCAVVDNLTRISPLFINLAGLLFFQTVFWCLVFGKNGSEYWHKFARLLLLCGAAAEGVLVFFQYRIAETFCSYCLLVFGCIILLTLLSGLKQMFRSSLVFGTVIAVSMVLQYGVTVSPSALSAGSIAVTGKEIEMPQRYLFFSGSCPHCEEVMDKLKSADGCSVRFNPVDRTTSLAFPGARPLPGFDLEVNTAFLRQLAIDGVPVMVVVDRHDLRIVQGSNRITEYLLAECAVSPAGSYTGMSMSPNPNYTLPGVPGSEDGCTLANDCLPGDSVPELKK